MEDASRSDLVIGRNTYLKLGKKKKLFYLNLIYWETLWLMKNSVFIFWFG